jgi:hypothetical protein
VEKRFSLSLALLDQPWGPPSLLFIAYRRTSSGIMLQGRGVDQSLPSRAEINNECRAVLLFALFVYTFTFSFTEAMIRFEEI